MAINAIFYENSVPKGTGILEITGTEGPSGLFIPLRATAINGTFHGPLGSLTLTQTFRFVRQALDQPIEAIYRFPCSTINKTGHKLTSGYKIKFF